MFDSVFHSEPQDRQPQDRQPQDRQPQDRQPQDRQPQDRQPQDRQPQDRQPQDRQIHGRAAAEHPDLLAIDRAISARLDAILDAEQNAMEVFVRRQANLRDRLLDLEDGGDTVEVTTRSAIHRGILRTAALDHVELIDGLRSIIIPVGRIESVVSG